MIIDLSFNLFNICQSSHYSFSLLLLARSSIQTSIRWDSSSVSLSQIWIACIWCRIAEKIFQILFTHRDYLFKKRRIVCRLQKMPELSLQRQQNVLTANSHRLRSGPCLFAGSLRVSFSKASTSHLKHPEIQKYTRSDPNSCLNILKTTKHSLSRLLVISILSVAHYRW